MFLLPTIFSPGISKILRLAVSFDTLDEYAECGRGGGDGKHRFYIRTRSQEMPIKREALRAGCGEVSAVTW